MSSASNIPAMNDITWIVFPSLQIKMNTNIYHVTDNAQPFDP